MKLPDFLQLTPEQIAEEEKRQSRLRQDFFSRAKQSPAEFEAARALIVEDSLKASLKGEEKAVVTEQLADCLAKQGKFLEAAKYTKDKERRQFYQKAAKAIYDKPTCECVAPIQVADTQPIRLPKHKAIAEVYSIPDQVFGFLLECNICGLITFSTFNPLPNSHRSDLELFKA